MEKGTINLSTANAVGAILNKKMGVTTGFSPSEWSDAINLMGKLPEATVSGSVAHFEDGADGVPLKSLVANIPANLEGVSSVEVVQAGKNVAKFSDEILDNDRTQNGVTFHATSENTVRIDGTATGGSAFMTSGYYVGDSRYRFLKAGTYTLSCNMPDNGNYTVANIIGYYVGTTQRFESAFNCKINAPKVFTLTNDGYFNIQISVSNGYTVNQDVWVQIEVGSTATEYEEYIEPTTRTVSLGRTIYGGIADIVTGEGESLYEKYIVTGQETGDFLSGTNNNGNRIGLSGFVLAQKPLYAGGVSNIGENKACLNSATWTIGSWCIYTDNKLYFVVPNEYTTFLTALQYLVDNNATFVFPLATPTDFIFTGKEINSFYGDNTIWNDTGDSSVTYRRDIELALSGSTPLMMMSRPPVTNEENITDENQMEGDEE